MEGKKKKKKGFFLTMTAYDSFHVLITRTKMGKKSQLRSFYVQQWHCKAQITMEKKTKTKNQNSWSDPTCVHFL